MKFDPLLNEKEVSAALNVSLPVLRKWRSARKELPFIKIGGSVRYEPIHIEEYKKSLLVIPE